MQTPPQDTGTSPRKGRTGRKGAQAQPSKAFWVALAAPGIIWLTLLFIVPFYAVLAIAEGQLNRLFESPIAVYNPLHWSSANLFNVWHDLFGASSFAGPIALRTLVYVAAASILSLLIAYPTAYFVSRFAGRRKGLFLVLLIAPFWISYMMRMLAWIDLLQTTGYVNKILVELAGRPLLHRHSRARLRLHPVPDPGALRGPGPDRPLADRGRAGSWPRPGAHVPAGHAAAVPAADPDRNAHHGAADGGRLLH
jgi:ABC-type sugar transport system permease subunit